jgi:hypothetical protein
VDGTRKIFIEFESRRSALGGDAVFRLARISLWCIAATFIAGAAIPCQPNAHYVEVTAPAARAEESAPLAPAADLIRRKGFRDNLTQLCDIFNLRPKCAVYNLATSDDDREVLIKANYPTDLYAAFDILVDPAAGAAPIELATGPAKSSGTAYAFLTDMNGHLDAVAVARVFKSGEKRNWDWKPGQITPALREMFAREIRLWSSEPMLKELQEAPDRKN